MGLRLDSAWELMHVTWARPWRVIAHWFRVKFDRSIVVDLLTCHFGEE